MDGWLVPFEVLNAEHGHVASLVVRYAVQPAWQRRQVHAERQLDARLLAVVGHVRHWRLPVLLLDDCILGVAELGEFHERRVPGHVMCRSQVVGQLGVFGARAIRHQPNIRAVNVAAQHSAHGPERDRRAFHLDSLQDHARKRLSNTRVHRVAALARATNAHVRVVGADKDELAAAQEQARRRVRGSAVRVATRQRGAKRTET